MARTKTKSGSKVKVTCPVCSKVVTKAGLIGHMAWKHGKDSRRPMLPSKARPRAEERRKAEMWDLSSPVHKLYCRMFPLHPKLSLDEQASLANAFMAETGISKAELIAQLEEQERQKQEMLRLIRALYPKQS